MLYLTEQTAPGLDVFPRVAAHLDRFRALLEPRRETQLGRRAWWQLHWPREERVFTEPQAITVGPSKKDTFVVPSSRLGEQYPLFRPSADATGYVLTLAEGMYVEAVLFGAACATEDKKEGTTAFLEKRAAQFKGK